MRKPTAKQLFMRHYDGAKNVLADRIVKTRFVGRYYIAETSRSSFLGETFYNITLLRYANGRTFSRLIPTPVFANYTDADRWLNTTIANYDRKLRAILSHKHKTRRTKRPSIVALKS